MHKAMHIALASAATAIVVVLCTSAAAAAPFINPPELNHPDWQTPFPYQRNILVGFDTDPHNWPDHITSPTPGERKALTPDVVHHEGTDDPVLYPSDWLAGDVQPANAGYTEWLGDDIWTGSDHKGLLMLWSDEKHYFTLTWHIDNWDRPFQEKHFYIEAEFYTTGNGGFDELLSSSGQIELLNPTYESLPFGWTRWNSWATLTPNPEWEEMTNSISFGGHGWMMIDYMHIATECVPEPATLALLSLGGLAIIRRK